MNYFYRCLIFHDIMNYREIADILARWFLCHGRDLPWKNTRDPYKIWISEVILQQTRVNQGTDYYIRFTGRFPDIHSLAAAETDEVMRYWQGLGYYVRARNLHDTARTIVQRWNGIFPDQYDDILSLKGIGRYTAAAVASFAFNQPYPVIDGNVYRVLARLCLIRYPMNKLAGFRKAMQYAQQMMHNAQPRLFNQAIIEFGEIQCVPHHPDCPACLLRHHCLAFVTGKTGQYPARKKKTKSTLRHLHYLVIRTKGRLLIHRREDKDIWPLLYQFPLIETTGPITPEDLLKHPHFRNLMGTSVYTLEKISDTYTHPLSHRIIHARFYTFTLKKPEPSLIRKFRAVDISELNKYPFPRLITRFMESSGLIFREAKME